MKKIKDSEIMSEILKDLGLPTDFYDLPYKSHIEEGDKNLYYLDDFNSDIEEQIEDESLQTNVNPIQRELSDGNEEEVKIQEEGENGNGHLEQKRTSSGSLENSTRVKSKSNSVAVIGTFSSAETLKLFRKSKNQRGSRMTFQSYDGLSQNERCLVDIEFLDGTKQEIEINSQTRCFFVCAEIAKKINLKSYLDYRIFLKDSKGNFRVLDDDELLFKFLFPHQNSLQNNAVLVQNGSRSSKQEVSLVNNQQILQNLNDTNRIGGDSLQESSQFDFNPGFGAESVNDINAPLWKYSSESDKELGIIKKTFKRLFSNFSEKYTIVFKKYLWLSPEQEEYDIRQDPVRLNLVCYQIFENIQQQRYKFAFKDYVLYTTLYLSIKYPAQAEKIIQLQKEDNACLTSNFPIQKLKEILPDIIYNSKEESYWIQNISETLLKVTDEVEKIQLKNQQIINKINLQQSQILIPNAQSSPNSQNQSKVSKNGKDISKFTSKSILGEKIKLMQMVVINAIKQNKLFGVTQFYVNTYKDTLRDAKELKENVWLGIKHNMIYVLGPEFKEELFQFKYEELVQTKVFPKLIHLILTVPMSNFKFNTTQSFEIKQLINEYQQITQLLIKSPTKRISNEANNS